jgi:hypothetical protein
MEMKMRNLATGKGCKAIAQAIATRKLPRAFVPFEGAAGKWVYAGSGGRKPIQSASSPTARISEEKAS